MHETKFTTHPLVDDNPFTNGLEIEACDLGRACSDWDGKPHVHCSVCADRILLEGEGSSELPEDATPCSCGQYRHTACICKSNECDPDNITEGQLVDAASLLRAAHDGMGRNTLASLERMPRLCTLLRSLLNQVENRSAQELIRRTHSTLPLLEAVA